MTDQSSKLKSQNRSLSSTIRLVNYMPQCSECLKAIQCEKPMMHRQRSHCQVRQGLFSGVFMSLLLFTTPTPVVAGPGHGAEEFSGGGDASKAQPIEIDESTATQLGIKVEPVASRRLAFGIPTTGQIEALPNQKVEVTTPVTGTVVKLFVQPGTSVKAGQPVAILSSPELSGLRVDSLTKRAEAEGDVRKAQADLRRAQQNYGQQQKIAATDIQQAKIALNFAQERYDKDNVLLAKKAIPRRQVLDSESKLAETKAALAKAESRLQVSQAAAELTSAQSDVQVAQSRIQLSNATYESRLKQLGSNANPDGTVTITAPIAGMIADREVSLGESASDPGKPLMTIVNNSSVLATANVYEKDLEQIRIGQPVRVQVSSLPNGTFQGRITVLGSVVEGQSRVLPVKAELRNPAGLLKPGMFAKLEILTDRTSGTALAIPKDALVDANGKELAFVQKGNAYQPVEVTLGRTAGDLVEVKSGLSNGDRVVTQGTTLLYAQSLRGSKPEEGDEHGDEDSQEAAANPDKGEMAFPWWLMVPIVGVLGAGTFWLGRRTKPPIILRDLEYKDSGYKSGSNKSL